MDVQTLLSRKWMVASIRSSPAFRHKLEETWFSLLLPSLSLPVIYGSSLISRPTRANGGLTGPVPALSSAVSCLDRQERPDEACLYSDRSRTEFLYTSNTCLPPPRDISLARSITFTIKSTYVK